jgi:uncharacterized membrane protein YfcA
VVLRPREAVPIIVIAQLIGRASGFWLNRKRISWPVIKWFSLGAVPMVILDSYLFVITPSPVLVRALGGVLLLIVAYHHIPWPQGTTMKLRGFALLGAITSALSGFLDVGAGAMRASFFLSYGLTRSSYVGTFSLCTVIPQLFQLAVLGSNALLGSRILLIGFAIGAIAFVGAYLGRRIVNWMPERWLPIVVEALLVVVGLLLIVRGG